MSHSGRLSKFAEQEGFAVESLSDGLRAVAVPCLLANGVHGFCDIEASCDPGTGLPDGRIGSAAHAVRITTDRPSDGRVYDANSQPIGNLLRTDQSTWSEISIRKGSPDAPEEDTSVGNLIHRYAKQIVGAVYAQNVLPASAASANHPFKIPYTYEDRTGIAKIHNRIRSQRVLIVGLGGTGSYVLDLLSKTPIPHIHLVDHDRLEWHNFLRAPGSPDGRQIAGQHDSALLKVTYYKEKYAGLRSGIHDHPFEAATTAGLSDLVSANPVDFAFVCIDQNPELESPRQDWVYEALSNASIPFIDSGISLSIDDDYISGVITTSAYAAGSNDWRDVIPNAKVTGDRIGYRNVQLPEINAAAASLAVMEWRRRTSQYKPEPPSLIQKLRVEVPRIVLHHQR